MEGPDGSSPLPIATFLAQLDRLGKSLNIGTFVGQGSIRDVVIGHVNRAADAAGDPEDGRPRRAGHEGRRVRPQHRPLLRAGELHADRRGRRARPRRRRASVACTNRISATMRRRCSTACARRSRSASAAACRRRSATRRSSGRPTGASSVETLRLVDDGARARRRRDPRSVSLHGVEHEHRCRAAAGLGARGRPGGARSRGCAIRPRARRPRPRAMAMIRDERGGGDPKNVQFASCGFDPSLDGKTLADLTARSRARAEHRERRRSRHLDRRAGRLPGRLPRHERRRPRAHPPLSGDDDRVRRRGPDLRSRLSPPAQLRNLRAGARRLRAREEGPDPGGRGEADVVAAGGPAGAAGSRGAAARHEGRYRGVRRRRPCATPPRTKSRTSTPRASRT